MGGVDVIGRLGRDCFLNNFIYNWAWLQTIHTWTVSHKSTVHIVSLLTDTTIKQDHTLKYSLITNQALVLNGAILKQDDVF